MHARGLLWDATVLCAVSPRSILRQSVKYIRYDFSFHSSHLLDSPSSCFCHIRFSKNHPKSLSPQVKAIRCRLPLAMLSAFLYPNLVRSALPQSLPSDALHFSRWGGGRWWAGRTCSLQLYVGPTSVLPLIKGGAGSRTKWLWSQASFRSLGCQHTPLSLAWERARLGPLQCCITCFRQ